MALSTFYLLGGIEAAALLASHSRGPDRLGVHYPGAGIRVPAKATPQTLAQLGIQTLPRPVDAPSPEPVIDGLPRRELSGQKPPRAAALEHVEDGVQDCPEAVKPGTSLSCGLGKMGTDATPFFV